MELHEGKFQLLQVRCTAPVKNSRGQPIAGVSSLASWDRRSLTMARSARAFPKKLHGQARLPWIDQSVGPSKFREKENRKFENFENFENFETFESFENLKI